MTNSNIVAGSNVFLSREDDPRLDSDFVKQVQDYQLLQDLAKRKQVDYRIPNFTKVQQEIQRMEIRCVYAKNDPCWGYSKSRGRTVCACINGECPKILECNPRYSAEDAAYWVTSSKERRLYGDPKNQRKYYFVDMISDEEMSRYISDPSNDGREYPVPINPVIPDKPPKIDTPFKIDPATGRKMVAVGARWMITDNASYENEELVPIWGFVEEVEEKQEQIDLRRKARRIEKKQDAPKVRIRPEKKEEPKTDPDFSRKEEFEKAVAANITDEIKLTDAEPDVIGDSDTVIILDNPAELAFVSSTFLMSGIEHGILTDNGVILALIDDYGKYVGRRHVVVSNTALKSGCKEINVQAWKALSEKDEIIKLHVADRDFYNFSYGHGLNRWTCRNMYGVTHVCIRTEDILDIETLPDGIYPVSFVDYDDTYQITEKDGTPLGHLGKGFVELIDALKSTEEISSFPATISGVSLQVRRGRTEFLGMGHLKFIEY